MNDTELQTYLEQQLPDVEFKVTGDGSHFDIIANGDVFVNLSRVKQQQLLNKVLKPLLTSGQVHAVNYKINQEASIG